MWFPLLMRFAYSDDSTDVFGALGFFFGQVICSRKTEINHNEAGRLTRSVIK